MKILANLLTTLIHIFVNYSVTLCLHMNYLKKIKVKLMQPSIAKNQNIKLKVKILLGQQQQQKTP